MKRITAVCALMLAISVYVSYPSAGERRASSMVSPSAMMAFDAV